MDTVNNRKSWPLIGGLISSSLCTIAGGHGFAPLLLLEIEGLSNQHGGVDAKWQSLAFITLLGQICIILAVVIKSKTSYTLFGSLGFLLLAIVVTGLLISAPSSFGLGFITSAPFLFFLILFFGLLLTTKET